MQNASEELVVVIEDDPGISHVLETILSLNNINAIVANNGTLGLKYIKEKKPQIILCDIMLPDMQGYDILKIVKENNDTYKIPFIFLTAFADPADVRKGMNEGADDYITKPFTADTIINAIKSRLEIHRKIEDKRKLEMHASWPNLLSSNFSREYMEPLNWIIDGANILINNIDILEENKAQKISSEISTSSYSLIRNIQKLMIYSKLQYSEGFNYPIHIIPNLGIILHDAIKKLKLVFYQNPVEMKVSVDQIINIRGNFEIIKYLFDEIIGNALKYGNNQSAIRINLQSKVEGGILFEVSNKCENSIDFTKKDIKPYKKFHQNNSNSLGIGLINCIKICEFYGYEFNLLCEFDMMYVSVEIPNK